MAVVSDPDWSGRAVRSRFALDYDLLPMNRVSAARALPFAILLVCVAILCIHPARAEDSCVSANGHATILTGKTVHPPADGCDTCHESSATPHPQKGKKTFKLTSEPPELCLSCHDARRISNSLGVIVDAKKINVSHVLSKFVIDGN